MGPACLNLQGNARRWPDVSDVGMLPAPPLPGVPCVVQSDFPYWTKQSLHSD